MSSETQVDIETIWHQIESLNSDNQKIILARIQQSMKTEEVKQPDEEKPKFRITDLMGSMKGVYTDPNADDATRIKQIDDYIRGERESWDC